MGAAEPTYNRPVLGDAPLTLPIGHRVTPLGHVDVAVVLEQARAPSVDGSSSYECRVPLLDGRLDEAIISAEEARVLSTASTSPATEQRAVDAEQLRALIESAVGPLL